MAIKEKNYVDSWHGAACWDYRFYRDIEDALDVMGNCFWDSDSNKYEIDRN